MAKRRTFTTECKREAVAMLGSLGVSEPSGDGPGDWSERAGALPSIVPGSERQGVPG
jgi:hypothetical protein